MNAAGSPDLQPGWERRAGLVAACIIVPILFFAWAKGDDASNGSSQPAHPPPVTIGDTVEVVQSFPGCQLETDIKQIQVLAFERHDATAAARYKEARGCETLYKGTFFEVSDMAVFSGLYCLRRRGDPDCSWFPRRFVKRTK